MVVSLQIGYDMRKYNASNERIKRKYYDWLKEANGRNEATVDQAAAAIDQYETYSNFTDLRNYHVEKAKAFKAQLIERESIRTKQQLSAATVYGTLNALKAFFQWLSGQPGYKQYFA